MSFSVYIIYSKKLNRFYTGTTDDVPRRLLEHNSGTYPDSFTYKGVPWEHYLEIKCPTSEVAYKLEKFVKSMKSASFIKKLKEDVDLQQSILKKIQG